MFQFKIVHHILPINAALHKFGITNSTTAAIYVLKNKQSHIYS